MNPQNSQSTNLQTPVNPEPQQVVQKSNNFIVVILSILLLISVLIASFFAYQTQNLVKELNELKTTTSLPTESSITTEEPTAIDSSVVDPTADWNEYVDIKNNLIFKYPKSWKIITTSESQYKLTSNPGYFLSKFDPGVPCGGATGEGGGGPCMNSASIQFSFGKTDKDLEDFDQDFWGRGFPITKKVNTKISNTSVVQAYTDETRYPYASLFKINQDKELFVTSEFFSSTDEYKNIKFETETITEINQILSTFKFTN